MRKHKKGLWLLFFVLQLLFIAVIKNFPEYVEQYYSNGLYIYLSKLMRYVFGWLPFSVGDVIYAFAIIYIIRWFIINRKRVVRDTVSWVLDIVAAIAIIYFAFHLLWGYNYYRQPLYVSLDLEPEYTSEALISFTEKLIEKSNALHSELTANDSLKVELPFSKTQVYNKVENGYSVLAQINSNLSYQPQSTKHSLYSTLLTYMGFSGYINPLTNEAQVDDLIPIYKYPTTACHEVAHQLGFAAENEANFIGCLAAIHNQDAYFKYCGYTFALLHSLSQVCVQRPDLYDAMVLKINRGIIKNYIEVQDFWVAYQNPLEPIFEKTFDSFLKANNQDDGVRTYSYVVALLVNYYKDKPL